jgi:predicted glycoside hydrolase/deacetylase ChbG (UPF0249 family)
MPRPDASPARRRLIVNADDFGQTPGVNEGVIRCCEAGIVTSASLMVRWPSAPDAADYARVHGSLSVGLHLDLGEWVYRGAEWMPLYQIVDLQDADAVRTEIGRQLETFERLTGSDPTHIDSHQHVHNAQPVRDVVVQMAERLGVPLRGSSTGIRHLGKFYGQGPKGHVLEDAITVEYLIELLTTLPAGTTELACHPGLRDDAPGMYKVERSHEVHVLCDGRLRAAIAAEDIDLISFRDLPAGPRGSARRPDESFHVT